MSTRHTTRPEDILERCTPELREVAEGLRRLITATVSDASERAYSGWNNLIYSHEGSDFCYIQPQRRWVNLGFPRGASLSDPSGVLEGTGRSLRHVKIRTPQDIDREEIRALITAASHAGGGRMGGSGRASQAGPAGPYG